MARRISKPRSTQSGRSKSGPSKSGSGKSGPAKSGRQKPQARGEGRPQRKTLHVGDKVAGRYEAIRGNGGFVVPREEGIEDLRITGRAAGSALHGDEVEAVVRSVRGGDQASAEIMRITKRANKTMLGRIEHYKDGSQVVPKNERIKRVIEIRRNPDPEEVPNGSWVMVEIRKWSDRADQPLTGRVIEVVGKEGDPGLNVLLLVREKGVPVDFPKEVLAEAEALEDGAKDPAEIERRHDLRGRRIFTVDPITAKDFDDAIELVERGENHWRVGVHIADVAHYVIPDTPLDVEAVSRSTSIYPVDRVVPMLPEVISNGLCSLRPGEDKLAMSAWFDLHRDGRVDNVVLGESVIHSVRRFSYEEVQALFDRADGKKGEEKQKPPKVAHVLLEDIMALREAAQLLRRVRFKRGALNLDLPEMKVDFGKNREVIALGRREHFEAHELIEEFMIAANEAVARTLEAEGYPALYRVHDEPDETKLRSLAPVLGRFGIEMPAKGGLTRKSFQAALLRAAEHPAASILQRWVLRAMKRAQYQPKNIGHYGLASESYLHFTSPIRRYPDLIVHRVTKARLAGDGPNSEAMQELAEDLVRLGMHTSEAELRAQRIEWDAEQIIALQYMKRHLGDVFEGYIGGVIGRGFFVELIDFPVEGMVSMDSLTDDFYVLLEDRAQLQGKRTGRTYSVGDRVEVMIDAINEMEGQMDLVLVQKGNTEAKWSDFSRRKGGGRGRGGGKGGGRGSSSGGKRNSPKRKQR